jgi:hypothetical protein
MSRAAQLLEIDTDDARGRLVLSDLCLRIFNLGIRAGASQALAVEQGADFTLNMDLGLLEQPDGPLS